MKTVSSNRDRMPPRSWSPSASLRRRSARSRHYTVHCAAADATSVVARAYDSSVIERAGGKAHAIELFKQGHPGATCWITGPTPNVR